MSNSNSVRLEFDLVLLVVFVILKLTGIIAWPWWWVLSPLWVQFLILLLVILFFVCKPKHHL